jgi:acetyl-CoA carboxylase carboxyl transferase subunit beta
MAWFKKEKTPKQAPPGERRLQMPEGLWVKCDNCKEIIYKKEVARNANVCPKCNYHFRISARERLEAMYDDGRYREFDGEIGPVDALGFVDTKPYAARIESYQKETGLKDAIISSEGLMGAMPVIVAAMEYGFMGGSMGSVVGEKITRAAERAYDASCPLIVISCSGGARMQEGALSLMQMAKISAALARLDRARLPYVSVLTDPTTGGVTASYAMLGDLNIAEPHALIGFAGPRVIEQTIRQKLPEGFQRSEFLLEKGFIDMVVDRRELKATLARSIRVMMGLPPSPPPPAAAPAAPGGPEVGDGGAE